MFIIIYIVLLCSVTFNFTIIFTFWIIVILFITIEVIIVTTHNTWLIVILSVQSFLLLQQFRLST